MLDELAINRGALILSFFTLRFFNCGVAPVAALFGSSCSAVCGDDLVTDGVLENRLLDEHADIDCLPSAFEVRKDE